MPMLATVVLALQLAGPVLALPEPPAEPAAASAQDQKATSAAQEQKAEAKEPPTPAHTGLVR